MTAPGTDTARLLADRDRWHDVVTPLLEPGELYQVAIPASTRPGKAWRAAAVEVFPFFSEQDRFLLVATDRAWLVVESAKERHRGDQVVRWRGPRDIRPESSWLSRFDGFDQPYAIDPTDEYAVRLADDALDAAQAGRPWDPAEAAARVTATPRAGGAGALEGVASAVGRLVPRRRRAG